MMVDPAASSRPSVAYLLSMAGGCIAIIFTVLTLGGVWELLRGHEATEALGAIGTTGFAFSFLPAFVIRIIFWPKASMFWRRCARTFVTAVFGCSIIGTVVTAVMLLTGAAGHQPGDVTEWALIAVVCQAGAVAWLLRFRADGL